MTTPRDSLERHDDLDDLTYGEYVLGVLDDKEHLKVELVLLSSPAARAAVAQWENRLAHLGERVAPQIPDPQVWERLCKSEGST